MTTRIICRIIVKNTCFKRGIILARGTKQIDGQLTFEMCLDKSNYVVQSNTLIGGKQALKVNSAKLIRAAIMQVVKEDQELKPYVITINQLSELLSVPKSNLYRDVYDITDDIIKNPVFLKAETGKKIAWVKIPWVTRCEYRSDVGIAITLNDQLKPYLINLKKHYTQYELADVLTMKSVYGIRIYELLQEIRQNRNIPKDGIEIPLSIETIREVCDCEEKYPTFSNLRARVIDAAVKDINKSTNYRVTYTYQKEGKSVTGVIFNLNVFYHT